MSERGNSGSGGGGSPREKKTKKKERDIKEKKPQAPKKKKCLFLEARGPGKPKGAGRIKERSTTSTWEKRRQRPKEKLTASQGGGGGQEKESRGKRCSGNRPNPVKGSIREKVLTTGEPLGEVIRKGKPEKTGISFGKGRKGKEKKVSLVAWGKKKRKPRKKRYAGTNRGRGGLHASQRERFFFGRSCRTKPGNKRKERQGRKGKGGGIRGITNKKPMFTGTHGESILLKGGRKERDTGKNQEKRTSKKSQKESIPLRGKSGKKKEVGKSTGGKNLVAKKRRMPQEEKDHQYHSEGGGWVS